MYKTEAAELEAWLKKMCNLNFSFSAEISEMKSQVAETILKSCLISFPGGIYT